MVLSTLGAAIGFAAFDPGQGDSASGLGIGAAIWFALTAISTMFIGGMTTGRLAGVLTRGDGMLHGVVMWSLSTLLAIYLISSGATRILGGVTSLLGQTTAAAVGGVTSGAGQVGAAVINQQSNDGERELDFNAIQREIETTLEQTGNPALSPDSLSADANRAENRTTQSGASNQQVAREVGDLLRSRAGQVDREEMVNVIAARTGKSRAEAEQIADRVQSAVGSARTQVSQAVDTLQQRAGQVAGEAANTASKAAWGALLLMGLSVAAAAFGAGRTARE
jgi:ElaB/YqjD/DUF883 family membrane-anchored ribosome-binding protein